MRRTIDDCMKMREFKLDIVLSLRDLSPSMRSSLINDLAKKELQIPGSKGKTISRSTIYRWFKEYRECADISTLFLTSERRDRGTFPSLTEKQKDALIKWRSENAYRTIKQLREELLTHQDTRVPSVPSGSTIARFLRACGYDRHSMLRRKGKGKKNRLSYSAEYPQQIWQMDTKGHYLMVKDPNNPENKVRAMLVVIIDDFSRYIVGARYVYDENQEAIINVFRTAISIYGVPETLYTDQGSPYTGKRLKKAATLLGCKVKRTPVKDAAAKGKVEKVMPIFTNHLESELKLMKESLSLEEADEYLQALIGQDYNQRVHSKTEEKPEELFLSLPAEYRRFVSENILALIFLESKEAKVSNTGLIRFNKLEYLVPHAELYRKKVTIRYQREDHKRVFVWYRDCYYGEAFLFVPDNDFEQRSKLQERMGNPSTPVPLPATDDIPKYNRIERLLADHRKELDDNDVGKVLAACRDRRSEYRLKQELDEKTTPKEFNYVFNPDSFIYLLCILLKRKFNPAERTMLNSFWCSRGPFSEEIVRQSVGDMIKNHHATDDLRVLMDCILVRAEV